MFEIVELNELQKEKKDVSFKASKKIEDESENMCTRI